jgi:hypothetical protein
MAASPFPGARKRLKSSSPSFAARLAIRGVESAQLWRAPHPARDPSEASARAFRRLDAPFSGLFATGATRARGPAGGPRMGYRLGAPFQARLSRKTRARRGRDWRLLRQSRRLGLSAFWPGANFRQEALARATLPSGEGRARAAGKTSRAPPSGTRTRPKAQSERKARRLIASGGPKEPPPTRTRAEFCFKKYPPRGVKKSRETAIGDFDRSPLLA